MDYPSVAVVILNYNGRNYLKQFLPSVLASVWPGKKIVVADNASVDDSISLVQKEFPSAELILLEKNYGFAEGYNRALQKIEADYYVLLNSDVEVTAGWIEPVIRLMESNPQVAVCQPKVLSYHNREMFEYAGAAGGWIDILGYPFARGRVLDICEKDEGQYNNVQEVFWASGAAMFVRAKLYHELHGLDSYFFAHMEEIDFCWRAQLAGYKIMCCPQSVVYHVGGGTLPKGNARKVFLNFRNNLVMVSKNLPFREKIWKLPVRTGLDTLFAMKCLFTADAASFAAVYRAYWSVLKWRFSPQKSHELPKRPMKELTGAWSGLLVWAYFIKKKNTFSQIVKKNLF